MKPKHSNSSDINNVRKLDANDYLIIMASFMTLPFILPDKAMPYYNWILNNSNKIIVVVIAGVATYILLKDIFKS